MQRGGGGILLSELLQKNRLPNINQIKCVFPPYLDDYIGTQGNILVPIFCDCDISMQQKIFFCVFPLLDAVFKGSWNIFKRSRGKTI